MVKTKSWFPLFLLAILTFISFGKGSVLAQDPVNAGFIKEIWYSQFPFFAGDQIRIYSAIQNHTGYDILGKIQFYDYNTLIGESNFSASNGRLIETWVDYTVTQGTHKIYAKLVNPQKSEPGKEPEPITLQFASSEENEIFSDLDTDGDRIGNLVDPDDDNDGLSDEKEIALGTDPLNPDSDSDGINDEEEIERITGGGEKEQLSVFNAIEKTAENIIKRTDEFFQKAAEVLEEKKITFQKETGDEKNGGPIISEKSMEKIEKTVPLLKIPNEKIPTQKDVHTLLLSSVIFVLKTWWLFLIMFLFIIIRILWKRRSDKR